MRPKLVPVRFKFAAKFAEIVNLAVEGDREGLCFVPDGLASPGQVNDAEPANSRGNAGRKENSLFVRTPMHDRRHHPPDDRFARFLRWISDESADSAHAVSSRYPEMRRRRGGPVPGCGSSAIPCASLR